MISSKALGIKSLLCDLCTYYRLENGLFCLLTNLNANHKCHERNFHNFHQIQMQLQIHIQIQIQIFVKITKSLQWRSSGMITSSVV